MQSNSEAAKLYEINSVVAPMDITMSISKSFDLSHALSYHDIDHLPGAVVTS